MEISQLNTIYLQNRSISTDTRNILPGSLFFALKGDRFNGNEFALQALDKGAAAAIVDEDINGGNARVIRVENVLKTLQDLARYHRQKTGITILAITGSNGKTTTKELCNAVLSAKFRVFATQGNLNNHIGVPLTLLSIPENCELAIVEMGANHPGEIRMLSEIALPDYGLITNIGKAHLEGFGGIEGVAKAKGELFDHLVAHGKTIFLNEGNSWLLRMAPSTYPHLVRYNGKSSLRAQAFECNPLLSLAVNDGNVSMNIKTNLAGSYNIENVLAACCVGLHFGVPAEAVDHAIASWQPKNNRSQLIQTGRNSIFMDAYNANPSSMAAAIGEFLRFEGNNKLLILGEMREVGASSSQEHEEITEMIANKGVRNVICVGNAFEPYAQKAGFRFFTSVDELNELMQKEPLTGYFIFVKGSRSNNLEKVVPFL